MMMVNSQILYVHGIVKIALLTAHSIAPQLASLSEERLYGVLRSVNQIRYL
jgi:hypothetical protein